VKHIVRLPVLAGAIVAAIAVTSLAPTPASRVAAQFTGYRHQSNTYYGLYGQRSYSPYAQGYYGQYGQGRGYYTWPDRSTYGSSLYGVSPYGYGASTDYGYQSPYGYGSRFGSQYNPYVRSYGGRSYYQPYTGGLYFGYGGY
jgi:hypothetical protein